MMNWWDVLEISHDSDLKTIKKAYAKLLKIYNPEDDAKGYQNLREAYDKAVKYAKKNNKNQETQQVINNNLDKNIINEVDINKNGENISESYSNEDEQIKYNLHINEIYHEEQDTKIDLNEQIEQFLNRLNEIYNDMYLRTDLSAWEDLLNSDVMWNVDGLKIIEDEIFNFLIKHKYLPAEIWTKLNNNFNWSKNEIKLYHKYDVDIVDVFLKNLKELNKLKYEYIKSINPKIADEYLYERQQADEALKYKKYAKAYNHLNNAYSLFSQDAELLRLMGDYNYEFKDIEKALNFYKSAFEINNYDLDSALCIAIILVLDERFSAAITYLKVYLSYENNDKLAINNIAYCYYYNDDLIMARESFEKLLSFDENNKTIKKYLKNIAAQLKGKHVRKIKFNKDNLMAEEVVKKEITTKKIANKKSRIHKIISVIIEYAIACIFICIVVSIVLGLEYMNSVNVKNTQNNKTYEDNKKENKIDVLKQILESDMKIYMINKLSNVKPIKYYKISEQFENRNIFSDRELDEKGLQDKVLSQLYIGTSESTKKVYIFVGSKLSDKNADKNGEYEISGDMCYIEKEIGERIKEEYASAYPGYYLIEYGFIDAVQAETNKTDKK